ncbi:MAG: chitobiase/beta-hexosaminidase C-terminal domain-containing protein [Lachnospiraceae bacterium]|nr:chitobiase/beta-hexosaminidase C-terminal domain-containing protein [Lachnospiraceae bacterium]
MNCKECGAKIPKGSMYCKKCGKDIQLVPDYNYLEEDVLSNIIQEGVKENLPDEEVFSSASANHHSKKKKRIWMIICSVCIVCVIIAAVVYFVKKDIAYKQANSYDYQFEKGQEYLLQQDYTAALVYFENALNLRPKDMEARNQIIHIYLETGEDTAAVSLLESMIGEDERNAEAWKNLIDIHASNEDYEELQNLARQVKDPDILELFADYLVAEPIFRPFAGTYNRPLDIEITCAENCTIYFSLDGSNPTENGSPYEESIQLKEGEIQILAAAKNAKGIWSEISKADYTVRYEVPEMPVVIPSGGNYTEGQLITIDVPIDCVAYFTWDGSEPTENSAKYTGPMEMPQGNQVLSVVLINSYGMKSRINRINYIYMP